MPKQSKVIPQIPVGPERIVFSSKHFQVIHQDMETQGTISLFEWVRRTPGVRSIVISKENKILLTQEYRQELKRIDFRLPGGKVFDSEEEYRKFLTSGKPIDDFAKKAAIKEVQDEAGINPLKIEYFQTSICGTTVMWDLIYFIVTDYEIHKPGQNFDAGEDIKISWHSFDEIKQMCIDERISEDRSVAMLLRFILSREKA